MTIAVTQAAEGLPRRAFTVAEVERMVELGVIDPDERFEMIGGEIVPMSPKGIRHERFKIWLNRVLASRLPNHLEFAPETTFRLDERTFLEPDFVIYDRETDLKALTGETALLAIEVADTSLSYDRGTKARVYSSFGLRELWVIDVDRLVTTVHWDPTPTGYRTVFDRDAETPLEPVTIPGLRLELSEYR